MSASINEPSIEAQIADCCRALYLATEPGAAMTHWVRLRELTVQKTKTEVSEFIRDTKNGVLLER